ncbi:DivIVA domain-containing protein [Thermocatellispora tengchongensis]|uniref:DivIVA domain-containing protein n=1 Tax=Thermocatellispora tengchongensis TaxID=1073253 RepID=A0A840PFC1_9ACTN|nr:DivIVA domain-containing protein [Thermocatellispora tengchongensis]MBB5138288.1 DivIVA domain-containing protein [Thermocatellispora tengchongensis]
MNRFPRVLGMGYDQEQVDALVRRIEATLGRGTLEGPPVTADEIRAAKFRGRLGGYNETAVDYALDAFIVAIETRGRETTPPAPSAVSTASPGVPGVRARRAVIAPIDVPAGRFDPAVLEAGPEPDGGEPLAEAWFETQAARVERAAFRAGRLGMGYDEDEVDAFLDRIVATLRGTTEHPVTAEEVRTARFPTVLFRPGYLISEVDGFLADIAGVLEHRQAAE